MDFSYSPGELAFRDEARAWIEENLPGDWGSEKWPIPEDEEGQERAMREWGRKLYQGGWAGITWPKEYGGRGATPIEQFIFQEEMAAYKTPPTQNLIGVGMAGPTLMAWGTPRQKAAHLEKILSGEEIWCQAFSEPNAGSDLAALETTATPHGDGYVVNGQKIWTSVAHRADWCLLLTRSDPQAPKHKGLTYLIVDMKSAGIQVKPLRQMTGDAEFNEIFFTDVRVPGENVLGQEKNGWAVAITTLMHERVNIAALLYARIKQTLNDVVQLTRRVCRNGRPLCEDPIVRRKLARFYASVETQRLNNLRMRAHLKATDDPGPIGSTFKLIWACANQELLELPVDILGPYAELLPGSAAHNTDVDLWMKHFLRSRANSIEGGTSEILRNIIGERVLGLPR
ncbi:MAG: acyl-CoA dehydrogenase [Acidobacteria bacterium]|nr:MAG: acyl-CoA dehydrogenase [Acidobacteriota bacterium]PYV04770.1 MAG: acyl-CoA dehydrogenase [Acidobacteriota bacterium]